MTIPALSEASNVSTSRISDLENEHLDNVTISTIELLAGALGCDVISLLSPISDKKYAEMSKDMLGPEEESDLSNCIYKATLQKTYYPPNATYNKISSMLELTLVLPLLDPSDLYENYFRILGQVSRYEEYISQQFDYSWRQVPDCPAKRFVEKELRIIREKRDGNSDFDIPHDEEYQAEYVAYKKLVIEKRKFINDLLSLTRNFSFSDLFSTDMT
jgi:transcriptional regulator with XRE-family HTH domain